MSLAHLELLSDACLILCSACLLCISYEAKPGRKYYRALYYGSAAGMFAAAFTVIVRMW